MKKLVTILLLVSATLANARGFHRGGYWIGPAVIGGVVGYSLARPYYYPPYYYPTPQPVVIQQPPVYIQQSNPAPEGMHQETILDAHCNCYRTVWVVNQ